MSAGYDNGKFKRSQLFDCFQRKCRQREISLREVENILICLGDKVLRRHKLMLGL
jgi:hypothetical protein